MKKLLWIGDAACPSGFARATHEILDTLRYVFDVTVLGLNYRGDPYDYPYPIYAAAVAGDSHGVERLIWMCDRVQPDVIIIQNDGWSIPPYVQRLKAKKANGEYLFPEHAGITVIAVVAIDGKNFQGAWLNDIDHAIFWTQFALDEARLGGYKGQATVIPLGVDLDTYRPMDKAAVRATQFPAEVKDAFIVGNVNRNQSRKRWDLTIKYFAEWINKKMIRDAWLYLQPAPTGDTGYHVEQLARYYGISDRILVAATQAYYGVSEQKMAELYNCLDVNISTTQGEGFGLTTIEAMACGVPCIVPDWSAYADWARGAAWLVPCTSTAIGAPYVNVIGGVVDERQFIGALNRLYVDQKARENNARAAFERANEPRYRWANIGQAYLETLDAVLEPAARGEVLA